jgi:hypothetical protein
MYTQFLTSIHHDHPPSQEQGFNRRHGTCDGERFEYRVGWSKEGDLYIPKDKDVVESRE